MSVSSQTGLHYTIAEVFYFPKERLVFYPQKVLNKQTEILQQEYAITTK